MRIIQQRDDDTSWHARAACHPSRNGGAYQTSLFFPIGTDHRSAETERATAPARSICSGCPVLEDCRAYARRWREPHGIWGGESTQERFGRKGRGRPPGAANKVAMEPVRHGPPGISATSTEG